MQMFYDRILQSKIRVFLLVVLLFFPSLEIFVYLYNITTGDPVLIPDYAFFLNCNTTGIGHVFQSVFLWFMPLYCLILASDDCIEDYVLGYKNILVSKIGRKEYIISHLKKSFVVSFLLVAGSLLINLVLVHIVFYGGQYSPYSDELIMSDFYQWEVDYPFLTNLLFTLVTAFVTGMISMVGTVLGIVVHNRKLVYGITMLLWMIPFLKKKSLMLLFQPHSEYVLDTLVPLAIEVLVIYLGVIMIAFFKEVCFEK